MTLNLADFEFVSRLVRQASAIVLEIDKAYLVESRLLPVARQHGHRDIAELVGQLRRQPWGPLRTAVVEAMTTNETSFFRDQYPFEALAEVVLPRLLAARRAERTLNIWCAASSSGQEPYSVAMLLDDAIGRDPGWRVRLVASDLSESMLERTRQGLYSQLEVNRGLPAPRLARHFRREGSGWRIEERLRRMVECRVINLVDEWSSLPAMDIVFLRNVLIYFDVPTKQRILARVRNVLKPDGYVFLGGAESTVNLDSAYERVQIGRVPVCRVRPATAA
jgi:chemotaxis protein methyltransferase CheR